MHILYILTTDITTDNDSDKRQIRPAVREGAPQGQGSNSQTESNTVKPVLNGISRVQNIFLLKPGFRLIKVYYDSHGA
jgi:hypothetical protein